MERRVSAFLIGHRRAKHILNIYHTHNKEKSNLVMPAVPKLGQRLCIKKWEVF